MKVLAAVIAAFILSGCAATKYELRLDAGDDILVWSNNSIITTLMGKDYVIIRALTDEEEYQRKIDELDKALDAFK